MTVSLSRLVRTALIMVLSWTASLPFEHQAHAQQPLYANTGPVTAPDGTLSGKATGVTFGLIFGDNRVDPDGIESMGIREVLWAYGHGQQLPDLIKVVAKDKDGKGHKSDADFLGWDSNNNGYLHVSNQVSNLYGNYYRVDQTGRATEIAQQDVPKDIWIVRSFRDNDKNFEVLKKRLAHNVKGSPRIPITEEEHGILVKDTLVSPPDIAPVASATPKEPALLLPSGKYMVTYIDPTTNQQASAEMERMAVSKSADAPSDGVYHNESYMVIIRGGVIKVVPNRIPMGFRQP